MKVKELHATWPCIEHFEWLMGMARNPTHVVEAGFGAGTEKAFKTTVEIDRLIDNLRSTEYQNVNTYVNSKLESSRCLYF